MSAVVHTSAPHIAELPTLLEEWGGGDRPIVLQINGRLRYEINDDASFRLLLGLVERLENIAAIQKGLDDVTAGRTVSLEEFTRQVRERNGI